MDILNLTSNCVFLSELGDLQMRVDQAQTTVTIKNEDNESLYSGTAYKYGYYATIYDIHSLIEADMLLKQRSVATFTIKATDSANTCTRTITVIFCTHHLEGVGATTFLSNRFFSSTRAQFMAPHAKVKLYAYNNNELQRQTITYTIVSETEDGEIITSTLTNRYVDLTGFVSIQVDYDSLKNTVATNERVEIRRLLSIDVKFSNRRMMFYVLHNDSLKIFTFRNTFNVEEVLVLPMSTTRKLETESSLAVCGNMQYQYDIEHKRSFVQETGGLLLRQAEWIEQFLTSSEVRYVRDPKGDVSNQPLILIVDYDYELSDELGEWKSLKFEWQFANKRESLTTLDKDRIFTEQFTNIFA